MITKNRFKELLKDRVLVLDGAMGTMIQRHELTESDYRGERFKNFPHNLKGNNDLLVLTQPNIISEIHEAYLASGADIIETNTFNANRISMADYHMEDLVIEMNKEAARLAREAADKYTNMQPDKPRLVAGSMGPTNKTASLSPDVNNPGFRAVTFDELVDIYTEQAQALIDGGVDILLLETVFDTLNCKAGLFAILQLEQALGHDIPVMVSGTITDASGRTLSGQTTAAFWTSIAHAEPVSIGLNCALGADQLRPYLAELSQIAWAPVSAHPNAGLPNEFGNYDQTPEQMGAIIHDFLKAGYLNIIGGCCGTTPDHIREIARVAQEFNPREVPVLEAQSSL